MGRDGKLLGSIEMKANGETIPYLRVYWDGTVEWLVSDEDQKKYEQAMLKNMGECMSRHYANHPEEI
ncbi:MAG: hypothetical protein IJ639_05665 [Ruminococcus sp.]|nr:hypothetical protein [Ruminococcus sp.]